MDSIQTGLLQNTPMKKTTSTIPKRAWLMWFFALELNYDEKL